MSDSETKEKKVDVIFKIKTPSLSSEEEPRSEWSSLVYDELVEETEKQSLYRQGLYDPGSGDICAAYVEASDSTMREHQYYKYPAVVDPGIEHALLAPEHKQIYTEDGQDLYLDLCKEMNIAPTRMFHRALLSPEINLRYYGVSSLGIRAMTKALTVNNIVTRLDLTSNRLNHDACYHIGELLGQNFTIQELVLCGCKIKAEGLMRVTDRMIGRPMKLLDLTDNEIKDKGMQHLSNILMSNTVIERLYLRNNGLTAETGLDLARALEFNNTITHLDLSRNCIRGIKGLELLDRLSSSKVLTELRMSWNSLSVDGTVLLKLLGVRTLKVLDFSNNRLSTPAAQTIATKLHVAKNLETLDLSHNQFTPREAYRMVYKLNDKRVKLKNFLLEDIIVTRDFLEMLTEILTKSYRRDTVVKYGRVIHNYTLSMPDMRTIVMKRLDYVTRTPKKCKLDIALVTSKNDISVLFFLQASKEVEFMTPKELYRILRANKANIDEDLTKEVALAFPGPRINTERTMCIAKVVEYVRRMWPDKKLPPTPPPEPEPEPEPIPAKKGKAKKGRQRARAA